MDCWGLSTEILNVVSQVTIFCFYEPRCTLRKRAMTRKHAMSLP